VNIVLHYVNDPLCGWCYGAEPLVAAAEAIEGLEIRLHTGGLWPAPTRLPEETRRYIQQADGRIAAMSGQVFGPAYLQGLLLDPTMTLESRPPTAAVLAAAELDSARALPMLRAVQRAHYVDGRRVVEPEVLAEIAASIGLDPGAFKDAVAAVEVDQHIADTHRIMAQIGARGFPAFALETPSGWHSVPHHEYASDPAGFASWLRAQIASVAA
jgi:putative protein-disulfide isomerase